MITLQKFFNLYDPEFITDETEIKLKTSITIGDINHIATLGNFKLKNKKCEGINAELLTVDQFQIIEGSNHKPAMVIYVSDNKMANTREIPDSQCQNSFTNRIREIEDEVESGNNPLFPEEMNKTYRKKANNRHVGKFSNILNTLNCGNNPTPPVNDDPLW